MGHKEIIKNIDAWPSSPGVERNTLNAIVALYHLLDERLPEKPMQVIDTPEPEVLGGRQMAFDDIEDSKRSLVVTPLYGGGFEFDIAHENGGYKLMYLSAKDARTLARSILATKSLTQD